MQALALTVCLGALRNSPVSALQVEAGEMSLWLKMEATSGQLLGQPMGAWRQPSHKKGAADVLGEGENTKTSFGWTGDQVAKVVGIYDRELCTTVLWPARPDRGLENTCVDLE